MLRSSLSSLPNKVGFAYRDKDAVSLLHPARIKISKKYNILSLKASNDMRIYHIW